ncbi:glycosyltransferase family 1 protein [Rivularia sp. UHCC 0363]|uniref:glycosyltransferase family 4 protein n=1 Tax=Rivularia sp. UHCC 0363 TaxID=3110244 RepID=UPI002B20FC32|nr:glycosyltransferase family 1 protein [Rivularia sp. UHCC 0363]MEA5594388.1 glycosyltransferase family 1 protein [Rivularia sp. UHCC 0363]
MFKVVIDATPIAPKPSGVGFYVANLIRALDSLQARENFQLGIAFQPGLKKWLRGDWSFPDCLQRYSDLHFFPLPVRISNFLLSSNVNPVTSYFEKYFGYPNLIHGTNYSVYPCNKSYKAINLYDLTFIKYPQYTNSVVETYTEKVKRCLQWTDIVLTISESSKQDIIEYLQVDSNKIFVTPLASRYHDNFLLSGSEELTNKVKYDFSQPYLLFVSTIEPRKNIAAIISAFNYLKQKYKIPHNLVLIGQKGWHYESIFTAIENSAYKKQIYHLDYLSDELVALFYAKADVFVYPSHYEGFGLPVLEAMTLGTPVVTSNTSSLPEVAGDAALLINPDEPMQLAEAILKFISDSQLRQEFINKGKERAKIFSWERTAIETLKAYRSIV